MNLEVFTDIRFPLAHSEKRTMLHGLKKDLVWNSKTPEEVACLTIAKI